MDRAFTFQQVADAAMRLPNPYHNTARYGERYHVALTPSPDEIYNSMESYAAFGCATTYLPVMDFELECKRDRTGEWKRWVFKGRISV